MLHDQMICLLRASLNRFTKQYANLNRIMTDALRQYHEEVKSRAFPAPEHTYPIDSRQLEKFWELVGERHRNEEEKHEQERAVRAHA